MGERFWKNTENVRKKPKQDPAKKDQKTPIKLKENYNSIDDLR